MEKKYIEGIYKGNEKKYGFVETEDGMQLFIPSKYKRKCNEWRQSCS